MNDYVTALCTEIETKSNFGNFNTNVSTIYIGGGTPSVLQISQLETIIVALSRKFNLDKLVEFTIEVNPEDITPDYAKGLKSLGVNRISMGVQSFIDEHLKWFGRKHTSRQAVEAFGILQKVGFSNISLDLIFGYKNLSINDLQYNLQQIVDLHPQHVSTYQLSIDEGSMLNLLAKKGEVFLLADEECYKQYSVIQSELSKAEYCQYEVSNFALPHFESIHNSNYWRRIPYLGFGTSAHSFIGNHREWNCSDIERYCDYFTQKGDSVRGTAGNVSSEEMAEELSEIDVFNEQIMLGLRTTEGINLATLPKKLLSQIMPQIEEHLVNHNLIKEKNDRIFIPADKLFVSDGIISSLML